jgi:hypothetical protein
MNQDDPSTADALSKDAADRRALFGALAAAGAGAALAGAAGSGAQADEGAAGFGGVSLLNRLKIMEEVGKYSWSWDSGEFEDYLSRYFEDGVLEHPHPDGSPGRFEGRAAIRAFLQDNINARPTNSYASQHVFGALVMTPEGPDVRLKAYCDIFRHEFHRQYWPSGPSFRMGTWIALYGERAGEWRLKHLAVKMWTDTAFNSGTAIQVRPPGSPGLP